MEFRIIIQLVLLESDELRLLHRNRPAVQYTQHELSTLFHDEFMNHDDLLGLL